jgi:hypothetical protein
MADLETALEQHTCFAARREMDDAVLLSFGGIREVLEDHGFYFSEISSLPEWQSSGPWLRRHGDIMARQMKISDHDL